MSAVLGAALLVSSGVPVYALGTGNSDVTLQVETGEEPSIVSVKVPTEIPLKMDKEGVVTVPQDLKITNLSDSTDVELTGLSVTGKDSWVVKDYSEDLSSKSEGTKELSMSFRGDGTTSTGDVSLTEDSWVVNRSSELLLNVSAKLPKQGSEYKEKGSIAQVNYTFAVKDGSTDPNENAIRNDWSKDKIIKDSVTPVTFDVYSTSPDTHIVSVESSNAAVTIEKAPETYSAEKIGSEVWNVKANNRGISTVTATLNTGETTTFTVNVYELNIPDGGDSGIEIELPDKKPGDNLETGDITIDIPIKNPDGSDGTITVTPEIPDGTPPLVEGENNINIDINIDINISINIDITINVSGGQQPSEQFTVTYITDGNGSVSEDSRKFNSGSNLTFPTATPNEGYVFDKWVDTTTDTEVTGNTLVNSNMEVKAVFVEEPEEVVLESIEVTKQPDKVEYVAGENFDPTGMEVTAHYSDGSTDVVDGWTVLDGDNLTVGKNTVTVQYIEDGITKECTVNIVVNEAEKEIIEIELTTENKSLLGIDGTETELDFSQPIEGTDGKLYQVVSIGDNAFNSNRTLKTLNLGNKVKTIGENSFFFTTLETISNTEKLENIGNSAFNCCYFLKGEFEFPNIRTIGESAFYRCGGVIYIKMGSDLTTVGNDAFNSTTRGHNIAVYTPNHSLDLSNWGTEVIATNISETGYWYKRMEDNTVQIVFSYPKFVDETVIPTEIDGFSVSKIGSYSYIYHDSNFKLTVPNAINNIGKYAFYNTAITSLNVLGTPDIENCAFESCGLLSDVTLNNGINNIGSSCFSACRKLVNINLPTSLTKISNQMLAETAITNITIPNNVEIIDEFAFTECNSLASITIPKNVKTLNAGVFQRCQNLRTVTIASGLTTLGDSVFFGCSSLSSVSLPSSLKTIGSTAFQGCNLTELRVPSSVTSIGASAFAGVGHLYYYGPYNDPWRPWGAKAIN